MTGKRFELRNPKIDYTIQCEEISDNGDWITYGEIVDLLNYLLEENEELKQQLAHHARMHEWFRNEAYLLQNKLDNREDEIRRLNGDVE